MGYGSDTFGERNMVSPDAMLALLGGSWPEDQDGFMFDMVHHFRAVGRGELQGFNDEDDPIGPIVLLEPLGLGEGFDPRELTFRVEHNPNCASPVLVRLVGSSGKIDGLPTRESTDIRGYGHTFAEAFQNAWEVKTAKP